MIKDSVLTIEAETIRSQYWKDLLRYRELFIFLAWRDIIVRYKQTAIGISWSLLRPFLTMVVFTLVFGKLAKLPSGGVPYPILVFVALLPWQFFSTSLTESSNSLVSNSNLVTKVYFPRVILPASTIAVSLVDFLISFLFLFFLMLWFNTFPDFRIIFVPLFLALAFLLSMGTGFWLSSLTVKYRDFRFIVPLIVQLGTYISPIGFSADVIPAKWRLLYSLNPMVGIIDGFRWSLLKGETRLDDTSVLISTLIAILVLVSGYWYFRRTEDTFADII
jgi:lipopolysaccharide transport system permease protein